MAKTTAFISGGFREVFEVSGNYAGCFFRLHTVFVSMYIVHSLQLMDVYYVLYEHCMKLLRCTLC